MNNSNGHFQVLKSIKEEPFYKDIQQRVIYLDLVIQANSVANIYKGTKIEIGQLITSLEIIASDNGLSKKQVRTTLKRLESNGMIKVKGTRKGTVITIEKYQERHNFNYKKKASKEGNLIDHSLTKEQRYKALKENVYKHIETYTEDMLDEFILYWTETSPKAKYLRFEKQSMFDVKRRLDTWFNRSGKAYFKQDFTF